MATTGDEFTLDTAAELAAEEGSAGKEIQGRSPWALAWRRLRRNYVALGSLAVFILVVVACLLAPLYVSHVSHIPPNEVRLGASVVKNGQKIPVVSNGHTTIVNGVPVIKTGGIPIGAQWGATGGQVHPRRRRARPRRRDPPALRRPQLALHRRDLGGDHHGRGGDPRPAGRLLRWGTDWVISRFFDLIWAFPVILLGIALGTALSVNGFHHLGINLSGSSLWITVGVVAFVFIPYIGRPLRGQILALRQREFVEAATAQGAGPIRIMFTEVLPNIASTVLVLFTLIIAACILTEVGLSFLGAGVQPPNPSWGTMIEEGQNQLATAPQISLYAGLAIAVTVLAINIFGDGLRDALDPRAKVRIEH